MAAPGYSLAELKAVVRILNIMLDIAKEDDEDVIRVSDVEQLRDTYQRKVKAAQRWHR